MVGSTRASSDWLVVEVLTFDVVIPDVFPFFEISTESANDPLKFSVLRSEHLAFAIHSCALVEGALHSRLVRAFKRVRASVSTYAVTAAQTGGCKIRGEA